MTYLDRLLIAYQRAAAKGFTHTAAALADEIRKEMQP